MDNYTSLPDISEKAREYLSRRLPNPSIPLSQVRQAPCCAVCGEDLNEEQTWKTLGDGETYLVCAKCAKNETAKPDRTTERGNSPDVPPPAP